MIIAAAHNITLGFQAGAFPVPFSIRLELVLIVAVRAVVCLDRSLGSNSFRLKKVCSPGIGVVLGIILEIRRLGSLSLSGRMYKMIRKR